MQIAQRRYVVRIVTFKYCYRQIFAMYKRMIVLFWDNDILCFDSDKIIGIVQVLSQFEIRCSAAFKLT